MELPSELNTETENEKIQFKHDTDICQQLMDRYATSAASQHRHLVATAAAMRSILTSESLPLTPSAYFAAAIFSLESTTLDCTEISALVTFLSIVVTLVPHKGIAESKANEAVVVLVGLVEREGSLGVASVKCVVKSLGVLLVGFCDLEDWDSVKLGFETLLKFSIDKRPKVRRCAQDCLEKVFDGFHSSTVIKAANKLIFSLLKKYIPLAITLRTSRTVDGSKNEILSKPDHLEVLHMLNVVKVIVPYLSAKISMRVLSELQKLMTPEFSPLTRHIFTCIEVFYETSRVEAVVPEMENIIVSLASYILLRKRNPVDTVMSAAMLLKAAMMKLHDGETRLLWIKNISLVCGTLVGLLTSDASTASQASGIVKELISQLTDVKIFCIDENLSFEDGSQENLEARAIKSVCAIFENAIIFDGSPNEHILAIVSHLFLKLGEVSYIFMKSIVLKLADLLVLPSMGVASTNLLRHCIGSAVIAMGPERILTLLPVSLNADDFTYSNIWLVPILKDHVVGGSLGYYLDHIVPLAKVFQHASNKVKKSVTSQDLQAHARQLLGLLVAFCRYPTDTRQKFEPLAKLLITLLRDSSMHEDISIALQVLVNQNRSVLTSNDNLVESIISEARNSALEIRSVHPYTKKIATKNIRALASCSHDLLLALTNLFINSGHEKCSYLKDAIGCLAAITDSTVTKNIFTSLLKRFQFISGKGEFEMLGSHDDNLVEEEQGGNISPSEKDMQRSVIMELAASFVEGANADLMCIIYNFIRHTFQASDETGHHEAYHTLSKILKEHAWFCSSRYEELIDLLLGLKSPADVASLRSRFACFHILMVHILKMNLEEENAKAFLILNEIILTLKDTKEEPRKAAYEMLLSISSSLKDSSCAISDAPYDKLINMIMGYLSGSSPHIKSAAVSAVSVLVHKDPDICLSLPDLVHSLLSLLQSKALEVIKAVLGFVKVIVSCLQAKDMKNLLADVISAVIPWSSVSRNHFRSKVTVILEIMIRKCGFATVELVTPEKYRKFVKTVLENRQNKSGPKEVGTGADTVTADSSVEGPHKRKCKEMGLLSEENGSTEHRKRKREKKNNFGSGEPHVNIGTGKSKWGKRAGHHSREKMRDNLLKGSGKNNRSFNKGPKNGGKRKMEPKMKGRKR